MKKTIICAVLAMVMFPAICFAIGGESYLEFRDGEVSTKFTSYVEFNQDLFDDDVRVWAAWKGINYDYENGTFFPFQEDYVVGIKYHLNDELTIDIKHEWNHWPMQSINGDFFSYRVTYVW